MPNSISEWFGHRVYPKVVQARSALRDQQAQRCPFLSAALTGERSCVKAPNSKGVCTVSSEAGGRQMDWVVCPYRTLNSPLLEDAARRLFGVPAAAELLLLPAPSLAEEPARKKVRDALESHVTSVIYFMDKLGGEIDLPGSPKSPKFKLDATLVQLVHSSHGTVIDRHGILEVQTMDYHGTYKEATKSLTNALELHPKDFARQLERNPQWASTGIEGPNIANVFKRTIYQVLFKFQLGSHATCAGAALALPESVWLSWQPHWGAPDLVLVPDGTWRLGIGTSTEHPQSSKGWILVFEIDSSSKVSPNPVKVKRLIQTDAHTIAQLAYERAPAEAMSFLADGESLRAILRRRIADFWPDIWSDCPSRERMRKPPE